MSIDTLEIDLTLTIRHVTLRDVDVSWQSIFIFEKVTWQFEFEIERQMKIIKHAHYL